MSKLLVIRFSALGDVAMVIPVLRDLAVAYPDWEITFLSRQQCASLAAGLPANVQFFGADLKGRHHGLGGLRRLMDDIHWQQFDAVADMHDVLRSFYIRHRMLIAGKRVAHIHKGRFQKWLLVRHHYRYKHPLQSTVSRYHTVLDELGFHVPASQPILSDKGNGIGIAPFAAHKGKIYPLEKMEEVVRLLGAEMHRRGEQVYLFGAGEHEKQILDDWAKKHEGVVSTVGRQKMDNEIEIMHSLRVMVTMDSSNMHLASLAGTRVISIWSATHPWAGFLGYGQSIDDCIQRDLPCRPCSIYGNRHCQFGDYRCMDIAPAAIVERVMKTIQ